MEVLRPSALSVESLSLGFPIVGKQLQVLMDVSFQVRSGETVCILGPSGCGKSTLLRCIAGLIPNYVGIVSFNSKAREQDDGGRFGFVFQTPTLLPWRTVQENASLGVEFGLASERANNHIEKLIAEAGLSRYVGFFPRQLSGGMAQRVALVRALAVRPEILLLDEPFGALDIVTRARLGLTVDKLLLEDSVAAVLVTHDVDEAVLLGDRVLVLSERPAQIVADVAVDLERPRQMSHLEAAEFTRASELCRYALIHGSEGIGREG